MTGCSPGKLQVHARAWYIFNYSICKECHDSEKNSNAIPAPTYIQLLGKLNNGKMVVWQPNCR
jgi:hypothetical protein